jgi:hypothetical protein
MRKWVTSFILVAAMLGGAVGGGAHVMLRVLARFTRALNLADDDLAL